MPAIRHRLGLMWRARPGQATNHPERLAPLVEALGRLGVATEPVLWREDAAGEAAAQLEQLDGVMVWVNPLADGQDRSVLDPLLAEASAGGKWVSAHPETIANMGVKDVLVRTAALTWSADVRLYETLEDLKSRFPEALARGPRVLKPSRGNDGQGVWRVEALAGGAVRVQAAARDEDETLELAAFLTRFDAVFHNGRLIDQAFQPRTPEGMVRCYVSEDRVVGFSEQQPRTPGPAAFGMASAKTMHPADAEKFNPLKAQMEREWVPGLQTLLGLAPERLPAIWDADFLLGPRTADGQDSYVLCEINASSVLPFPPVAAPAIAETAARRLTLRKAG